MSWSILLGYFVLHTILVSLLVSLLNMHIVLDFPDFAFYNLYNNTFVSHSANDRFFSNSRFHSVNSLL
jgi:hypothetical protein